MLLMMQQWEVGSATGRCAVSGRELVQGEEFYTVLFAEGDSFRRADYSIEAWTGPPEGAFCHFKSRVPVKEAKKRLLVNDQVLIGFFERLAGETVPIRVAFRFVIALILMRKRLLKYESSGVESGVETWEMMLMRDHSRHQVVNPNLSDDEVETVSRELSAILHDDMGAWADRDEACDESPTEHPPETSSTGGNE